MTPTRAQAAEPRHGSLMKALSSRFHAGGGRARNPRGIVRRKVITVVTWLMAGCSVRTPVAQVGGTPTAAVALPRLSELTRPARVALRFWRSLGANDLTRMETLVAFPFVWDARCRILTSFDQIRRRMSRKRAGVRRIAVAFRREITSASEGLHPHVWRSYRKLSGRRGGCGRTTDALVREAATHRSRYILIDLLVGKKPAAPVTWVLGKNRIPSVTRVSFVQGRWKVTGFDN